MSAIIAATVTGGAAIVGSLIAANSAKKAAATQSAAAQAGIAEQRTQFDKMQSILAPYVQTGYDAQAQQKAIAGLAGPDAQRAAIESISNSPEMLAMTRQGEEAMMQQGAATGGLRGGNIQGALAQFRPQMLSSLINQQYGRLGGLAQLGQASAAGVGAAGMQSGAQVSDLLQQQGAAVAGGQLGVGQAWQQPVNMIGQMGQLYGMHKMGVF